MRIEQISTMIYAFVQQTGRDLANTDGCLSAIWARLCRNIGLTASSDTFNGKHVGNKGWNGVPTLETIAQWVLFVDVSKGGFDPLTNVLTLKATSKIGNRNLNIPVWMWKLRV